MPLKLLCLSECQFSAFEGSSATFKGSLNVFYCITLLIFITIGVYSVCIQSKDDNSLLAQMFQNNAVIEDPFT